MVFKIYGVQNLRCLKLKLLRDFKVFKFKLISWISKLLFDPLTCNDSLISPVPSGRGEDSAIISI